MQRRMGCLVAEARRKPLLACQGLAKPGRHMRAHHAKPGLAALLRVSPTGRCLLGAWRRLHAAAWPRGRLMGVAGGAAGPAAGAGREDAGHQQHGRPAAAAAHQRCARRPLAAAGPDRCRVARGAFRARGRHPGPTACGLAAWGRALWHSTAHGARRAGVARGVRGRACAAGTTLRRGQRCDHGEPSGLAGARRPAGRVRTLMVHMVLLGLGLPYPIMLRAARAQAWMRRRCAWRS